MSGQKHTYKQFPAPHPVPHEPMKMVDMSGRRVAIYTNDFSGVPSRELLDWSDIFFSANFTEEDLQKSSKLMALGPVFSITAWGSIDGYRRGIVAGLAGSSGRSAIAQSRFQRIARSPIESYTPSAPASGDYVFMASRRWAPKHPEADAPRARFIEAIRSIDVRFEGGFLKERIDGDAYRMQLRRSAVAFNSPAVHGCLGWKLGEYLALGKAILSTDLGRGLPSPLEHGRHIHFVDDDVDAIRKGLQVLLSDDGYRRRLEVGAREWYEANLCPAVVAKRVTSAGEH